MLSHPPQHGTGVLEREALLTRKRRMAESHRLVAQSVSTKTNNNAEFYGYALYIITIFMFVGYLTWAFVPNEYLDAIGWTYYPEKHWAIAVPAFLFMFLFFALAYHLGYVLYHTPSLESIYVVTDECVLVSDVQKQLDTTQQRIPPFEDVPVRAVSHPRGTRKHQ